MLLEVKKQGLKRKRSSDIKRKAKKRQYSDEDTEEEGDYDLPEAGVMKVCKIHSARFYISSLTVNLQPDITFFGEDLPATFHDRLVKHDKALVDLVIVIGTSLKVAPVSEVVGFLPSNVPQIYISRSVRMPYTPIHASTNPSSNSLFHT